MSRALRLSELLGAEATLDATLAAMLISGLCLDSRRVQAGDAFIALAGASTHGLAHAANAEQAGASVVLFEPPVPAQTAVPAKAIGIPGLRAKLGAIADRFHGQPSSLMPVIGVTGTNGKTSTVQLLAQALDDCGLGPCGTLGTLGVGLGGELRAGERTTPDVLSVHASLAELRGRGAATVAMEVSSHALDQGRVDAVRFAVAVFSNLTRDHLDYHGDMPAYGAAKARLFAWPGLRCAVINVDDAFGAALAKTLPDTLDRWTVSAAGDKPARLSAQNVSLDAHGLAFDLVEGAECQTVRSRLLGRFNIDNLLAVAATLRALAVELQVVAAALGRLKPVPGRMNRVDETAAPVVVIDYAHTPDALEQALTSLRAHTPGELICVFGCGGERDRGKRPQMAAIAERLADAVIVTDDNPRREDGEAIVREICAGFTCPDQARIVRDRAAAIRLALGLGQHGDTVLIAGKGHETYQEIGGRRLPFDDAAVAAALLRTAA